MLQKDMDSILFRKKIWNVINTHEAFVKTVVFICYASLVAQMVKNLPTMQEPWVRSLGWDDPLEEGMATHSNILAWRIPLTEEPGRLQSMVSQRVRHDWVTKHIYMLYMHIHVSQMYITCQEMTYTNTRITQGESGKDRQEIRTWIIYDWICISLRKGKGKTWKESGTKLVSGYV